MADGFKDRDEFLDALFDHIFDGDDEVEDDDQNWFNDRVASFFAEQKDDDKDKGGSGSGANAPRRRRPTSSGTGPRRRRRASSSSSGETRYGSKAFFGN